MQTNMSCTEDFNQKLSKRLDKITKDKQEIEKNSSKLLEELTNRFSSLKGSYDVIISSNNNSNTSNNEIVNSIQSNTQENNKKINESERLY